MNKWTDDDTMAVEGFLMAKRQDRKRISKHHNGLFEVESTPGTTRPLTFKLFNCKCILPDDRGGR